MTVALRAELAKENALASSSETLLRSQIRSPDGSGLQARAGKGKPSAKLRSALIFLLAEQALLAEMVEQCEALMKLCRSIVGEATFMPVQWIEPETISPRDKYFNESATASIQAELERHQQHIATIFASQQPQQQQPQSSQHTQSSGA